MSRYASSPPIDCCPTSDELDYSPLVVFATQAPHDTTQQNELRIHHTDDSDSFHNKLLDLLDPGQKEPSPSHGSHISVRNMKSSPSFSSIRPQIFPEIEKLSNPEICDQQSESDKLCDNKNTSRCISSEETKNINFYRLKRSSNDSTAMITGLYQQENPFANYMNVPHQYLCIPHDQKVLLDSPESWFRVEKGLLNHNASIPSRASEALHSFLENFYTLDDKLDKSNSFKKFNPKGHYYIPESTCRSNLQEFPFRNNQTIPTQYLYIPDNQKVLLDDPNSWFRPESENLISHPRIPPEVSEKLSSFICSNLSKVRDMKNSTEVFNKESEVDKEISANQDHELCNEDRLIRHQAPSLARYENLINSCNTRSHTPDVISRAASIIEEEPLEIRSQDIDDSYSPEIDKYQINASTNTHYLENDFQESFYSKFKLEYPEYTGNHQEFTWALLYIERLSLHESCLDSKLWDDFVRVLSSDYLEDVCTRQTSITGLEYYKLKSYMPLFTRNLLSLESLPAAIRSLDPNDVIQFRKKFYEEPIELGETIEESSRSDLPHESKSDNLFDATGEVTDLVKHMQAQELRVEALRNPICNDLGRDSNSKFSVLQESTDQLTDLSLWRKFLKSRKLAGALNHKHSSSMKRFCTIQRTARKQPTVRKNSIFSP